MYNFECDDIASVDKLGTEDAAECNSASNSVSDRVCAPTHTVVGYMGGDGDYPNYDTNYTQLNYSETLRMLYDPAQTNFSRVLDAYWKYAPAPTISQPDPAYMLRIFTTTPAQAAAAAASKAALEKQYNTTVYVQAAAVPPAVPAYCCLADLPIVLLPQQVSRAVRCRRLHVLEGGGVPSAV